MATLGGIIHCAGVQAKGLEGYQNSQAGSAKLPWGHAIASKLVHSKVKAALGLSKCKVRGTGPVGLPLSDWCRRRTLALHLLPRRHSTSLEVSESTCWNYTACPSALVRKHPLQTPCNSSTTVLTTQWFNYSAHATILQPLYMPHDG